MTFIPARDALKRVQIIDTPTGPMSLVRPIAERLLKEGVISGTLDGPLHAADAATVKAATILNGVCDFCSAPGPEDGFDVPDFDMPGGGRAVDGWAACAPCAALIRADRRKDLLARAVNSLTFGKFTKPAIAELHSRFWQALDIMVDAVRVVKGLTDFVDDRIPDHELPPDLSDRTKRMDAVCKLTGLSVEEVGLAMSGVRDEALPPALAVKIVEWAKRFGHTVNSKVLMNIAGGPHKPLPVVVPHWQAALDATFEVRRLLSRLKTDTDDNIQAFAQGIDLNDPQAIKAMVEISELRRQFVALSADADYRLIRTAQVYSFNAETEAAIREAAASIPHDAPLSSIETPNTGSGWFWFSDPLPIPASSASSDFTHALLWGWEQEADHGPALTFSAYVREEKSSQDLGMLFPSARWTWPVSMTFHDMLALNTIRYREVHGPGGALVDIAEKAETTEATFRKVIADLSLFFVMSCVWFRQTVPGQPKKKIEPVLTQTPGHIERHARKRYVREHKLDAPPIVQIVALRKTARVDVADAPTERVAGAREYHCKWIVKGHPRMQACGPGHKDRKLIWITAHIVGPDDMPLRTKTTVYAVVR